VTPAQARLRVVGLGPAGRDLLTVAAAEAVAGAEVLILRTARHAAAAELAAAGVPFVDCDDIYDNADTLADAYVAIAERVLQRVAVGEDVVYAVPGSPHVAEATVRLLRGEADRRGVDITYVDGLSFLEPVLAAVGVDPLVEGVMIADGRRLDEQLGPPLSSRPPVLPALLVAQVDRADVLSDVKLALLEWYPPDHEVSLVVGAAGEHCEVRVGRLAELDWSQVDPGPLASLYVPSATAPERLLRPFTVTAAHREAGRAFADLVALQDRLRSPGGCPWDADQTHASLARHLLDEAYEVVDVLDRLPPEAPAGEVDPALYSLLEEELGDFVMQAVFHARLAEESGAFDAEAVVDGIVDKLVLRHPHVFGDLSAADPAEVVKHWEDVKAEEKSRGSVLDDIPVGLPALMRATKVMRRTERSGVRWGPLAETLPTQPDSEAALGQLLLAACASAREQGLDPEGALRSLVSSFEAAFRRRERDAPKVLEGMPATQLCQDERTV